MHRNTGAIRQRPIAATRNATPAFLHRDVTVRGQTRHRQAPSAICDTAARGLCGRRHGPACPPDNRHAHPELSGKYLRCGHANPAAKMSCRVRSTNRFRHRNGTLNHPLPAPFDPPKRTAGAAMQRSRVSSAPQDQNDLTTARANQSKRQSRAFYPPEKAPLNPAENMSPCAGTPSWTRA